jgi:hypothetical protein
MSLAYRPFERWRLAAALLFALMTLSQSARIARAECTQLDAWPPFAPVVANAKTVFVGEVVRDLDPNSNLYLGVFGVRVDQVVRGSVKVGDVVTFDHLRSGLPLKLCQDSYAAVLEGDVIAFALDSRAAEGEPALNAIAYVSGSPDGFLLPGVELLTTPQYQQLIGPTATETTTPTIGTSPPTLATQSPIPPTGVGTTMPGSAMFLLLLLGVGPVLAVVAQLRKRRIGLASRNATPSHEARGPR